MQITNCLRAAVVQLNSRSHVGENLETALRLIDRAASLGAQLVVLPEKFHYLGPGEGVRDVRERLDGPLMATLARSARDNGVYIVAGSIWEELPGEDLSYNTSVLIDRTGKQLAVYRKIHMFDVEVAGRTYRESDECRAGDRVVAADLPGEAVTIGLSVCYDLRFPELYRALMEMGTLIVAVPSAFTMATGRDHWEVLLRARAIENQVFVVAANQTGEHRAGSESCGRSMIVDPWGVILAQAPDEVGVTTAELDLGRLARLRENLPVLGHRSPAAYAHRVGVR